MAVKVGVDFFCLLSLKWLQQLFLADNVQSSSASCFESFQWFLMGQIPSSRLQMHALCFRHTFAGDTGNLPIASERSVQQSCGAHAEFYRGFCCWCSAWLVCIPSIQAMSQLGRIAAPVRGKVQSWETNLGCKGPLQVLWSAPTQSRSHIGELGQGQPGLRCLQDGVPTAFPGNLFQHPTMR